MVRPPVLPAAPEVAEPGLRADERRAELQGDLAARRISLDAFSRAWRALDRPVSLARDPDREALEQARRYLADFGSLWRDDDVPAELKEEAAREIFEQLDLVGERLVAVCPRAEHAWLLGMAAKKSDDLVLVGARGLEPPTSSSRTTRATYCATPRPSSPARGGTA
jgi:hypothetical protein